MQALTQLFAAWAGEPCAECLALGANGSNRRYYRMRGATHQCIGTVAADVRENEAFFAYTRHFLAKGIPVPELYVVAPDRQHYLQQDLGDQTLYGLLTEKRRQGGGFDAEMLDLYRQALSDLAAIQLAGRDIDFSKAYPREAFDSRSIHWDLNYFKYYFLKLADIPFDEELLENDFDRLTTHLLEADCTYFLYRDFNPRNIMLGERLKVKGEMADTINTSHLSPLTSHLYYIDYQGGRRGAAQYDVASLLYSAKSELPQPLRDELLRHYLDVRGIKGEERDCWCTHYRLYVLIRILQTLGAYGFRGLYERKDYFLQSIPLALTNLRSLLAAGGLPDDMPELLRVLNTMAQNVTSAPPQPDDRLTVTVQSFSYKKGLPQDTSGNGGGHIFDCRALPNPGRYPEFKCYTGNDRPVIEFLSKEPAVDTFLTYVKGIVGQSVEKYTERRFTNLSVAFGCTGGQHRSVYCAAQLARWLRNTYPDLNVALRHREQQ